MIPKGKIYEFDPGRRVEEIVLVGCGGTGGGIARSLARLMFHMRNMRQDTPDLTFIDHDTIDETNIGRQMFTPAEIGMNKAQVMARRFNVAMGLQIEARPRMLRPADFVGELTQHRDDRKQIVIGAVDNAAARKLIHDHADQLIAWIDAGNHEFGGQVIIGNCTKPLRTNKVINYRPNNEGQYRHLPAPSLVMPALIEEDDETLTCAQLTAMNRQDIFVNDWMADVVANYVKKLLLREEIRTFMTFIDTKSMNMRSVPLTRRNLRARLEQQ